MMELEEEKAGVKGKQRMIWGEAAVSDTAQVWRTISPLWAACPTGAGPSWTTSCESCQPEASCLGRKRGGGRELRSSRVLSLLQEEREHEIRGMGRGAGEKGVLIEEVWSKKPNISLSLSLAGGVTNTLLSSPLVFRTFCPFFQLLLPGLSGVQLASEGQLCAAV